jgi:hypothetical protein
MWASTTQTWRSRWPCDRHRKCSARSTPTSGAAGSASVTSPEVSRPRRVRDQTRRLRQAQRRSAMPTLSAAGRLGVEAKTGRTYFYLTLAKWPNGQTSGEVTDFFGFPGTADWWLGLNRRMTGRPHQSARRTARRKTHIPDLTPVQILENGSIDSLPKNAAARHSRLPVSSTQSGSIRRPTGRSQRLSKKLCFRSTSSRSNATQRI